MQSMRRAWPAALVPVANRHLHAAFLSLTALSKEITENRVAVTLRDFFVFEVNCRGVEHFP